MSGPGADAEGGPKMIPIDQLNLQDLSKIQQQIEQEVTFFGESYQELKTVHAKFKTSAESLGDLGGGKEGNEILIPLTTSMYVPGKLKKTETVLVDIGTGYYADMPIEKAKDYFERKQEYLSKQMDSVQNILSEKTRTKAVIMAALESKVQQSLAQQQAQAQKS